MKINITHLSLLAFLILFIACEDDDSGTVMCMSCELQPKAGPCNAAIPKYYFDEGDAECKEFIWGGCEGVVPFNTLEECQLCACS